MIGFRYWSFARGALALLTAVLFFSSSAWAQNWALCGMRGDAPRRLNPGLQGFFVPSALPPADTQPSPVVIEVMFLYTPEALAGAGEEELIPKKIREAVDEANYAFTNSQVNVAIRPVYIGLIPYLESGDIGLDLTRLVEGEGEFAGVNTMRNDYKADIVCLITELENQGIGGLAWDIPPLHGNPYTAFLAVRRTSLGRNTLFAHELGHLLGCAHDREHAGDVNDPFYTSRRSYIFGHRLEVEGVTYIDVMAYEPGVSLPYFANPRLDLDGVPLGIAEGQPRPSDTARAINETAPYVAVYREALSRVEFEQAGSEVLESDGDIMLRLRRTGNLNTSTRVSISVATNSTAQAGFDYIRPAFMAVQFATGQAEASFTLPLVQDELMEGSETIRFSLAAPVGSHGVGPQGQTTVMIRDHAPVIKLEGLEGPSGLAVSEARGTIELQPIFAGLVSGNGPQLSWRIESDSAVGGVDYLETAGELKVEQKGGAYQIEPIRITLLDDAVAEPDKIFSLVVAGTTHGGVTYASVTNEIRILDNDRPGALLAVPGAGLKPDAGFSVAVRHDGKFLLWGAFSRLRETSRTGIALLNADGTLDASFQPPEFLAGHRRIDHLDNAIISALQVLPDGKLLLAGQFSRADGKPRTTLARLNPDGSLDDTFGSSLSFDGAVNAFALQPDGKVLIGGGFEKINGQRRPFIARLNADGTVDETFAPNGGPSSSWTVFVLSIAVQPDGKILMGGLFEQVDGVDSANVARLHPDGTFDSSFNPGEVSGPVLEVQLQTDGRIVLAGLFDTIAGRSTRKLARLHPNGALDLSFRPPLPNAEVRQVITLPDGRLLVNGAFTKIADAKRRFLALLNSDGTLHAGFDPGTGPDFRLGDLSIHADGSLYLPGTIEKMNGLPAASLARVKLGQPGSAITGIHPEPDGTALVRAWVFPGGNYPVQASDDLSQWTDSAILKAEGYGREAQMKIPRQAAHQFLRLRNPAE